MVRELVVLLFALAILQGCQTKRYKEFSRLKEGMEKDEVIEEAGGPNVSRRWHGKDRWIYTYRTPEGRQTREVHFEDGRAVYVGDKVVPLVSPEDQDRINDQSNVAEENRLTAEHIRWAEEHGVAYKPKTGADLDDDDVRLQESFYGTRNVERARSKVAPTFKEVN
jgi:outer membrane protein assembly factor BamE (lipoprotein component of BamABCDE complex)